MRVTVIGSGSWGSAFSRLLARKGHDVTVLTLTPEEAVELSRARVNAHVPARRRAARVDRFRRHRRGGARGRRADRVRRADADRAPGRRLGRAAPRRRGAAAVARQGSRARHAQAAHRGHRRGDGGGGGGPVRAQPRRGGGPRHAVRHRRRLQADEAVARALQAGRHVRHASACTPTTTSSASSSAARPRTRSRSPSACRRPGLRRQHARQPDDPQPGRDRPGWACAWAPTSPPSPAWPASAT